MLKLSELGEWGLIRRIAASASKSGRGIGIGDDAAVIPDSPRKSWVVTTDALVEGIHFLRDPMPPEDLGYKTLAVNLSDIAAMGARPHSAFLSWALPSDLSIKWIDGFLRGLEGLARQHNVALLGGDTTGSKQGIFLNITALGFAPPGRIKLRSTARPGDLVCVTDTLGDSAAGLKGLLSRKPARDADRRYLLTKHFRPRPQLEEGLWLAAQRGVHAMMDVSDGIDSDLRRILEQSKVGAYVSIDALPLSPQLERVCRFEKWNPVRLAASGGEDYALLITVQREAFDRMSRGFARRFGRPLHLIGEITSRKGELRYFTRGREAHLDGSGFEHFKR